MKKTTATIKQFDYTSKEDFKKDITKMNERGYKLIENGMFNSILDAQKITGDDTWKFTAYFIKSDMM